MYVCMYAHVLPASSEVVFGLCYVCVLCVVIPFILDVSLVDVPAGVTQEEGHT